MHAPTPPLLSPTAPKLARGWLLLVPAYPVLALIGALTHQQAWSLAALLLLLSLLMAPALRTRQAWPWLAWAALVVGIVWLAMRGLAGVILDAVPMLINLMLAWLFGRSLRAGRHPLVAQVIEAVEGEARLELPGVRRYARRLTGFWMLLLATQGLLLGVLQACAVPGGLFVALGHAPPFMLPAAWSAAYGHLGSYAVIVAAFVLEYGFRRWHLRHLPHPGLRELMMRVALRWPQLMRGIKVER